ncbi:viral A-type inclusion protein [Histomonas meleagridis]|uniref:viral A-type inclusion protein n=1 Tax=Histomonas meleagridis TaxID=135588 RepID=UPI00355AB1CF|nr:viral A-type inclusion protein [Histomonas meleagridis]KAH0801869.1 viral A-type inclusion protein [Histomonas meleagridis]
MQTESEEQNELIQNLKKEINELNTKIEISKENVNKAEEVANESKAQFIRITKERHKYEAMQRKSEKKIAELIEEKDKLNAKIEALEKDLKPTKQSQGSSNVFPEYVRKVLLQFFIQNGETREALIPVILKIVECDDKQILKAQRCWAESNQIISKPFSFFGSR